MIGFSVQGLYCELRKSELQVYLVGKCRKERQKWNNNCEMDVVQVAVKKCFSTGFYYSSGKLISWLFCLLHVYSTVSSYPA